MTRHEKEHNHELCGSSKTHLFRSHRRVTKNQLIYLQHLKESGIPVCDGIRLLKKQSGGSPFVGFVDRDAYNHLALENFFGEFEEIGWE